MPYDHQHWGVCDHHQAWHHGTAREETELQSGKTLPAFQEALAELTLGIWVSVAKITDVFILELYGR
jgi:hypothetical protein